ncbi:MAG: hypothetical protein K9W44_07325 [Candidatus Lokiarchaeota archaeon]|nr:hypothetical protein [Candidatus Harpocratesius repetitus]
MGKTRFVHTEDLKYILSSLVLQGDVFSLEHEVLFWKSLYDSIEAVEVLIETRIKRWKGSDLEKPLKSLKKQTTKFIKKVKKLGTEHGSWCGASDECAHLLNRYRMQCIPNLLELAGFLAEDDLTRQQVEGYLLF